MSREHFAPNTPNEPYQSYESFVRAVEQLAHDHPWRYKCHVMLLMTIGYALIGAMVVLPLVLLLYATWASPVLWSVVWHPIGLVLAGCGALLTKLTWTRMEAVSGYCITREEFPVLFFQVDALANRLHAPAIHEVRLTTEFNAGIYQRPRFGFTFWTHNTLVLGLELLLTLSPQQVHAVIAHEMGHLAGNHGRFSASVCRLRTIWYRVMMLIDGHSWSKMQVVGRWCETYSRYLNAYTLALSRENEFTADATAVTATSKKSAAEALVSTYVIDAITRENYWRPLFRLAEIQAEPPHAAFAQLADYLANRSGWWAATQQELVQQLLVPTDHLDTHPSLGDRLRAMNCPAVLPQAAERSAATIWFGSRLEQIIAEFDKRWREEIMPLWHERYAYVAATPVPPRSASGVSL